MNEARHCSKCGLIKPLSAFSKQSDTKSGLRSHCKDCMRVAYIAKRHKKLEAQRAYYLKHKDERLAYARSYRVANAEEIREKQRLVRIAHIDERRAYDRKRYRENPEARMTYEHNRRSAGGSRITTKIIRDVKAEYGGICPYCNKPITKGHVDHITPVIKDGTNDRSNLVYCCASCNHRKGNKSLLEFMLHRMVTL